MTGRRIIVYGQNEVVKDLIAARMSTGRPLLFEVAAVAVDHLNSKRPRIFFNHNDERQEIQCDFIAGCDGFHGICRPSIPENCIQIYERAYPFGCLGILANAAPSSPELVYSRHPHGFALFSMRSNSVTRLYLQCAPDEDLAQWPDDRICLEPWRNTINPGATRCWTAIRMIAAASLAGAAVLRVDDIAAAPRRYRECVRLPAPARRIGVRDEFVGGNDQPGRKLRRISNRL